MEIIAVDPGDMTGWARLKDGVPTEVGELEFSKEVFDWIDSLAKDKPDVIVIENYRIRPQKGGWSHQWGEVKAIQVIGALKYAGHALRVGIVLQEPSVKPMAYKLAGMTYVKGKSGQHIKDAVAHGVYFASKTQGGSNVGPSETS